MEIRANFDTKKTRSPNTLINTVRGVDMGLENVTVGAGQRVKVKLVVHYDTPLQPSKRRPP